MTHHECKPVRVLDPQTEAVAGRRSRRPHPVVSGLGQGELDRARHLLHLPPRAAAHRPVLRVIPRRPGGQHERHPLGEIVPGCPKAAHRPKGAVAQRDLRFESRSNNSVTRRTKRGRNLLHLPEGGCHAQRLEDRFADIFLIRNTGHPGYDASQDGESGIGIFVRGAGGRRKWDPFAHAGAELLLGHVEEAVAPGIVLRKAGRVGQEMPDGDGRGIQGRIGEASQFGNVPHGGIIERKEPLVTQFEDRGCGEAFRHRGDAEYRLRFDCRSGLHVAHAPGARPHQSVCRHDAHTQPGQVQLVHLAHDLGFEFRKDLRQSGRQQGIR